MEHPGEGVGPEACAKTAQTSTCIHTRRRVALYRFGHPSVPCRQRPIPHPAGPSIADFEETQPSHMQAQWSPRKPIGRTPNVILAKSCAHQEAARRSIKNSTISDSIVRGRALSGAPAEAALHRRDGRQAARCAGRTIEGDGHRHAQRQRRGPAALAEAQRVVWRCEWRRCGQPGCALFQLMIREARSHAEMALHARHRLRRFSLSAGTT